MHSDLGIFWGLSGMQHTVFIFLAEALSGAMVHITQQSFSLTFSCCSAGRPYLATSANLARLKHLVIGGFAHQGIKGCLRPKLRGILETPIYAVGLR